MRAKIIGFSILLAVVPTLLVWIPFFFRMPTFWNIPIPTDGMGTVVANYDGPLYIVVAKSLYNADIIKSFPFNLPVEYYAAHFPLYPILIRIFSGFLGFPYAMLGITILSSAFAFYAFHRFIAQYVSNNQAFWLTFVFSLLPARFLIVRSVGSPEPLFVGAIIASVYYFQKKNYLIAGLFGAIAQLTKSPGILLFLAYFIVLIVPAMRKLLLTSFAKFKNSLNFSALGIFLIPLSLLGVFYIYSLTYHNFFAYFQSGDNIHLFFPPFQIFNYSQPWVQTHWLEEIIFVYLFAGLGVIELWKQKDKLPALFTLIFFTSIIFVSHRDLIRYALPVIPFLYAAFGKYMVKREFKILFVFLILPIYLFSLAFISKNVMPVTDWASLL